MQRTTTQAGEPRRKEGHMASIHSLSPVTAAPASQAGALDGHEVRCSCGFVARTSLSAREALRQGCDHLDWAKRAGK